MPTSNQLTYEEILRIAEDKGQTEEVLLLLQDAADKRDPRILYALASWYINGVEGVVEKNKERAISILREIQYANIPEALFDLAVFYDLGDGVEDNEELAFSLYMRAALLGDSKSCEQVSGFFEEGKLVPHDREIARAWLERSELPESEISPPSRLWITTKS